MPRTRGDHYENRCQESEPASGYCHHYEKGQCTLEGLEKDKDESFDEYVLPEYLERGCDNIEPAGGIGVMEVPVYHLTFHEFLNTIEKIALIIGEPVFDVRGEIDESSREYDEAGYPACSFCHPIHLRFMPKRQATPGSDEDRQQAEPGNREKQTYAEVDRCVCHSDCMRSGVQLNCPEGIVSP